MQLSHYVKTYPLDDAGSILLYSTLRGAQVKLSQSLWEAVLAGESPEETRQALMKLGFLVHDREAEKHEMRRLLQRINARATLFHGIVVLNLDCNLDCIYCYEGGFRNQQYLSESTAELLVQRLVREHLSCGRNVTLTFYGGEPLLSQPMIARISKPLREAAEHYGAEYGFDLVTNGTLLTREMVESLLPLGLKGAQVTLDGPGKIHNLQRPYASGADSFQSIVDNLLAVWQLVPIQIGGNYREDNFREFPSLMDHLTQVGLTPDKVQFVFFSPVTPQARGEFTGGCACSNEPWVLEAGRYLRREILHRGYRTKKVNVSVCMVEMEQQLVVNWDGSLYKCPALMAWPELSVGSLAEGITDYTERMAIGHWQKEECLECAYLPLCFGGCRYLSLLRGESVSAVECRRELLDATLEETLKQDLLYP